MTQPMLVVFMILSGAIGLFIWGRPRADIVALLAVLGLLVSGVLTPQESFEGFSNEVVIILAAVFIVGEALVNTGVVSRVSVFLLKVGAGSETRLIILIMLIVAAISAFMSSAALVAMFIPVVFTITSRTGLNRKRMLMPLAVAATIGGMMTLISSSTSMIVSNTLSARGLPPLGFFSVTPFGFAVLATGIVVMLMGRGLLSKQQTATNAVTYVPRAVDLLDSYGLASLWYRLRVPSGSPLIGRSVAQLRSLYDRFGVVPVGLERNAKGTTTFLHALPETIFETGDAIFVIIGEGHAKQFIETQQLTELPRLDEKQAYEALQELGVAEIMLLPESKLIGRTVGESEFRSRYRVSVLALRHHGERLTRNLAHHKLSCGDTLLIAGGWDDITRLRENREDFIVLTLAAEYQERLPARRRAPVAVAILVLMAVVMAFDLLPISAAALLAALAMLATRCVPLDSIYRVVGWGMIVLIGGMMALVTALTKTGATSAIANGMVTALGSVGPIGMLIVVFVVVALFSMFLSNNAAAILIAPVAIDAAQVLHVPPEAFAMTVAISCSASFVTPVSTTWNLMVMEPGGYSFGDYVKVGLPLLLLTMLITITLVMVKYQL